MEHYPIILKPTKSSLVHPDKDRYATHENPLENHLFSKLMDLFQFKIRKGLRVSGNGFHYFPDIAYIDSDMGIYIDIELDEPYSESQLPIHYKECIKDQRRNMFFQSSGWHVVRFSEYQIINSVDTCVKLINRIIQAIERKYVGWDSIKESIEFLKIKQDRWSKAYSERYIRERKREFYEFDEEIIHVEAKKTISDYDTHIVLVKQLIEKHITSFNYLEQYAFVPKYISNVKIYQTSKKRMIFAEFYVSQRKIKTNNGISDTLGSFSKHPSLKFYEESDNKLFNLFIEVKKLNRIYNIKSEGKVFKMNPFHGIILYGSLKDYHNGELKWIKYD